MGVNKGGRPPKFNEDKLLQIVKDYVDKEHDKEKPIKKTKLAKNLKDKGLNIVYQDLDRYKKVKDYIEEYNILRKSQIHKENINISEENTDLNKKNTSGRPRKFDEDELLTAVKGYVKSFKNAELIKITKVAKFFQSKGINITYQDLNRYKKVKKFIQEYNEKYKEVLFAGINEIDIEKQTPIFKHINIAEFLKRNKTSDDIERALITLNQTNEKLVESYEKLQRKIILQNEKIIIQSNEIERLNTEIEKLNLRNEELEEELKLQNKKFKENILIKARKMAMYEEFINKYHYSALAEYATNLELGCNNEHLTHLDTFFDKEKYLQGEFKLKDIADKYAVLNLTVDNTVDEYLDEPEFNLALSKTDEIYFNDLSDFINKEHYIESEYSSEDGLLDDIKIDKLDLSIEDIDSSLSFLDEV